ncbi:hypothetical protein Tco_0687819 [Tanacetum coccineum]
MIWRGTSLRYGTGEKKVNEVDFISQGVELTLGGSGGESFWEEGDDFGVDVLCFHTCLTDILSFLEKLEWRFEQDIDDEGEEDEKGEVGSEVSSKIKGIFDPVTVSCGKNKISHSLMLDLNEILIEGSLLRKAYSYRRDLQSELLIERYKFLKSAAEKLKLVWFYFSFIIVFNSVLVIVIGSFSLNTWVLKRSKGDMKVEAKSSNLGSCGKFIEVVIMLILIGSYYCFIHGNYCSTTVNIARTKLMLLHRS